LTHNTSPNTVPPCIKDCSVEAAGKAGCSSPLDVGCVCGDKKDAFTQAAIPCITSKCGADALGQAQGIQNELCTNGVKQ